MAGGDSESKFKRVKSVRVFEGSLVSCEHESSTTKTVMRFNVFFPKNSSSESPVLYYLSGLTCTPENVSTKGGAFRAAAKEGIVLVFPDTSPRGAGIEGEDDDYDLGSGASMYVDATSEPWSTYYKMFSYITSELPSVLNSHFSESMDVSNASIFGHSMGGHGALVCFCKKPGQYRSVSAFAPISNVTKCPWGEKTFSTYFRDRKEWDAWDASHLLSIYNGPKCEALVDQGLEDTFLHDGQLRPETLEEAARTNSANVNLTLRRHEGYDHSYYFISTFMDDHIAFHARHLKK